LDGNARPALARVAPAEPGGVQWDKLMGNEVLNQSDIDALLNEASAPAAAPSEAPPTQIFSRSRRDRDKIEIEKYDFKRPERISKDQMRTRARSRSGPSAPTRSRAVPPRATARARAASASRWHARWPNASAAGSYWPPPTPPDSPCC